MSAPIDTRLKLMQIATQLIWDSNYDNVGIADICKQAGVTKGAFYHHFSSKAELFASACKYDCGEMNKEMDKILSPRFTALQQFENFFAIMLEKQYRGDGGTQICGCPFFTSGAQAGCEELEVRAASRELSDNGVIYFAALARNLQAEGCLQRPVDAEQLGRLLHQFVQGLMMHGRIFQDFAQFCLDLREGLYQLLGVKEEHRNYISCSSAASIEPLQKVVGN